MYYGQWGMLDGTDGTDLCLGGVGATWMLASHWDWTPVPQPQGALGLSNKTADKHYYIYAETLFIALWRRMEDWEIECASHECTQLAQPERQFTSSHTIIDGIHQHVWKAWWKSNLMGTHMDPFAFPDDCYCQRNAELLNMTKSSQLYPFPNIVLRVI